MKSENINYGTEPGESTVIKIFDIARVPKHGGHCLPLMKSSTAPHKMRLLQSIIILFFGGFSSRKLPRPRQDRGIPRHVAVDDSVAVPSLREIETL